MIEIKNLSKCYTDKFGNKVQLFENLSFEIKEAQITSVIAPVGSGKSSLIKIISGLETQTEGEIKSNSGKIIYIPSEPSSFPWLSVKGNIIFGLKNYDESTITELINFVGLEGYSDHYPNNKSVGFRFRIALARSLANSPQCICIDEPFNKMDLETKSELYLLLREVVSKLKTAIFITTTNITEAVFLSDKIYLMGNEPASIFHSTPIVFDEPRELSIVTSDKFKLYIDQIETHFKKIDSKKILFKTI